MAHVGNTAPYYLNYILQFQLQQHCYWDEMIATEPLHTPRRPSTGASHSPTLTCTRKIGEKDQKVNSIQV